MDRNRIVLVSLYQVRYQADHGEDTWWVVAHRGYSDNDLIIVEGTREDALEKAFSFSVPVMFGSGDRVNNVASVLAADASWT